MSQYLFGEGDLVWAKYDGFPNWPARIAHKHEEKGNPNPFDNDGDEEKILVFFYGSLNYGWVPRSKIEDFKKKYETYYKKSKKNDFKVGLKQAQDYLRSQQVEMPGRNLTTMQSHPQKGRIMDNHDNAKPSDNGESPSIKMKDIGESSIKNKDYGESSIKKKDYGESSTKKKDIGEPSTKKNAKSKITPSKSVPSDHSDSDIEEKTPKSPLTTPTTDKNKEKSTTKKSPTEKSRNYSSDESEEEEEKNSKNSSRTPTVKKKEFTPKTPISQKKWNYDVHSEENEEEEKKNPKNSEKTPNTGPPRKRSRYNQGEDQVKSSKRQKN